MPASAVRRGQGGTRMRHLKREPPVPDHRTHRGPHPEDAGLFAPAAVPDLRAATGDLSWLLTRGYASPSALKVAGDRYHLNARQRIAVMRCACSDAARDARGAKRVLPDS